jgi:hypothetical protein
LFGILAIIILVPLAISKSPGVKTSATTTTTATTATAPEPRAYNAAEIGDEVSIKYTGTTIVCESLRDAGEVFIIGALTASDALRMGDSVNAALDKSWAARKAAIRQRYSCYVPRDGVRYRVVQKEIVGTQSEVFHNVNYCLRPLNGGNDPCVWLIRKYDHYSPFNGVEPPAMRQQRNTACDRRIDALRPAARTGVRRPLMT